MRSPKTPPPHVGAAIQVPKLGWIFRSSYSRFYQPPPLITASGPVLAFANSNDTTLAPLHGERDEEHQFGVEIPFRGWTVDANTSKNRVNNFSTTPTLAIPASTFPSPSTARSSAPGSYRCARRDSDVSGRLISPTPTRSPNSAAALPAGLICTPVGDPACDAGFSYTPVDHDQRNTLNVGFNATLPRAITASTNVSYGSGFTNGGYDPSGPPVDPRYPNQYLPAHTTFDLALGKTFTQNISATITATNVANRRILLDNSLTFGGFHYNDPRQIYAELRYRFKF